MLVIKDHADKRPNKQIQEYGILEVEPRMRDLCLGFWLCRLLLMLEESLLMRIWIHLDCVPVVFSLDGKGLDEQIYALSTVFAAVMANFLGKTLWLIHYDILNCCS